MQVRCATVLIAVHVHRVVVIIFVAILATPERIKEKHCVVFTIENMKKKKYKTIFNWQLLHEWP